MKQHVAEPRLEDEEKLNALAQSLYETRTETFRPMFPWVFVRVLPREQITEGGIILPQHEQNKTIHEGIVLATWAPVAALPKKRKEGDGTDWRCSVSTHYSSIHGHKADGHLESDLEAGDHVLFPFSAGMPIAGFSDTRYRIVKEMNWTKAEDGGGIFARVLHRAAEQRIADQLVKSVKAELEVFDDAGCDTVTTAVTRLSRRILNDFVLVERGGYSVTLSGR